MPSVASPPPKATKPEKKHKHKHSEEKKRKRDRDHEEDGHKHKSKKHRPEHAEEENKPAKEAAAVTEDAKKEAPAESPFHLQTSSLYLPLASISQRAPLEGMCAEHLSPLLLTYFPPLHGVVLSYNNPRLSEAPFRDDGPHVLMKSIDEYAVSWAWVTAEFLLFKPERGVWLEGYVNLQNEGHLGVVCWNLFNASIQRQRLPTDWKWVGVESMEEEMYSEEGSGYYVDGEGKKVEGVVKFRVKDIESSHDRERGFLSIEGTMLSVKEEDELLKEEHAIARNDRSMIGRRLGGSRALGATSLAVATEPTAEDAGKSA